MCYVNIQGSTVMGAELIDLSRSNVGETTEQKATALPQAIAQEV